MQKIVKLNLSTSSTDVVKFSSLVKYADSLKLEMKVYDESGNLLLLTGKTISLILKKSDATIYEQILTDITEITYTEPSSTGNITKIGSLVSAELDTGTTNVLGITTGELQIGDSEGTITTNNFTLVVVPSLGSDVVDKAIDEIRTLTELRLTLEKYAESAETIAGTASAVHVMAVLKEYIDTNLPLLESNNAEAATNNTNLQNSISQSQTLKNALDLIMADINEFVANHSDIIDLDDRMDVAENSINSISSDLSESTKHINKSVYNVKEYGAIGDGISDDWVAINNVLDLVKNTGGVIEFPTGIYAISKPIEINNVADAEILHNIVLKGVSSNIPYFYSYGENPSKLAMNSNIIPTSNFVGDALIIIGRVSNSLIQDLALIGAKTNQDVRTIKGILYNSNPIVANNSVKNCTIYRFTTGIDGYNAPILKIEFCNVQYCKDIGIRIRGDSRIVECEVSCTGVYYSGVANEMSTKAIFQPSGYYGGTGIVVIDSAGNTNIIGGLIDWNCKGIVADAASGLIVNGTRFHHNAEQHIWIRSRGGGLGAAGFNISGCRFLGGGFLTGTLDGKSHITVTNESTTLMPIYGNITGNVFRVGDWDATENSDSKITTPSETTGPLNSAIIVKTNCDVDLTITGNDMVNSATPNGSVGITQTDSSKLTKIKFYGNNTNKIGWTSGNVRLFSNYDMARVNGKPSYTGFNGEKTENTSIDPYVWDNYIYSTISVMWIGINQRNIKYDTTANRPIMNGYTDRGYRYHDTTINKQIFFDGVIWRDVNGTSV